MGAGRAAPECAERRADRRPIDMNFTAIALLLCACAWAVAADAVHLKAAKARLLGGLLAKAKHHKRGVLSSLPPYKLGHDIPIVSHSVLKPLVVTYPPAAAVATVKVPLTNPLVPRYPVPVGHRVPVPHPHYGLKFPHVTKSVVLSKPDHHFHHHHHHVSPRPVVPLIPAAPVPVPAPAPVPVPAPAPVPLPLPAPVPAAPFVPVAQPTAAVAHPAPLPSVLIQSGHNVPASPLPVAAPPIHVLPPNHLHLKPLFPAPVPVQPAHALHAPLFQYAQQFPYVLRHGGAVQTSVFATYPRYPFLNYQSPLIPLAPTPSVQGLGQAVLNRPQVLLQRPQVLLERPQFPQFHLVPQAGVQGSVVEQAPAGVSVEPTPTILQAPQAAALPAPSLHIQPAAYAPPAVHLQPAQPSAPVDHEGWSPVIPQAHDFAAAPNSETQFSSNPHHHFTQEQGTQIYEQHTGDGQYNDLHHQLQHHIQKQIEQAQYEQHVNTQHQLHHQYAASHQPGQEYGVPGQEIQQQAHEYAYHGHEYAPHDQHYIPNDQQYVQNGHNFGQEQYVPQDQQYAQPGQQFGQHDTQFPQHEQHFGQNDQQFSQQDQQFAQHDQQFSQHDQPFAQHDQQFAQHDQQFAQHDHQYGLHDQQFAQHDQQFAQHDQQFAQHDQQFAQHDQQFGQHDQSFLQQGQEYDVAQQPAQEYGLPQQGPEGRKDDGQESEQQFHNHIPLGLQPPINEPLDHFR
ncbi:defective chorion protein, FC106 isoform-like [Battus philenor]|uniref:defective chorion protein, FC106 isoform-like n=1 Tax=Battus philenor TaxID=42288 RepID=UPI0035D0BB62